MVIVFFLFEGKFLLITAILLPKYNDNIWLEDHLVFCVTNWITFTQDNSIKIFDVSKNLGMT